MSNVPAGVVTAPPRLPLPYGLFSQATERPAGDRWEAGVTWEVETFDEAGGLGEVDWAPGSTGSTGLGLPKSLDSNLSEAGSATPFAVYGHFRCSPVGWTVAQAQAAATAHLQRREEARVERALWTGDLGNEPNLTDAEVLAGGTAVSALAALAMLEDKIAGEYGSLGVIHMSRGAALQADRALEAKGGRLYTKVGTPVVAGGGYPGTGPAGQASGEGTSWAYVTPPIFYYRSQVITSSSVEGDLLDRGTNDLYAIAERTYLLGFDPAGVAAVNMQLLAPTTP